MTAAAALWPQACLRIRRGRRRRDAGSERVSLRYRVIKRRGDVSLDTSRRARSWHQVAAAFCLLMSFQFTAPKSPIPPS